MADSCFPPELRGQLFKLTLALYRVTDFFSPNEPLRRHIREKANEIFSGCVEYGYEEEARMREAVAIIAKIDALRGHLRIAESLRIVKPVNIQLLEKEYRLLWNFFSAELKREEVRERGGSGKSERKTDVKNKTRERERGARREEAKKALPEERIQPEERTVPVRRFPNEAEESLNDRQRKILSYFTRSRQARIGDLLSFFTDISSKTIQRDLKDLVGKDILKKEGDRRGTIYSARHVL